MEKSGGRVDALINQPEFPTPCAKVWSTFSLLADVSYSEIAAYTQVTGEEFQRWEVSAIIGLDRIRKSDKTWSKQQS